MNLKTVNRVIYCSGLIGANLIAISTQTLFGIIFGSVFIIITLVYLYLGKTDIGDEFDEDVVERKKALMAQDIGEVGGGSRTIATDIDNEFMEGSGVPMRDQELK